MPAINSQVSTRSGEHTSDWRSDVCSSDLVLFVVLWGCSLLLLAVPAVVTLYVALSLVRHLGCREKR